MQIPQVQQQPITIPGLNIPAAPGYDMRADPNQALAAIGQRQKQFTQGLTDFSGEIASNIASQQALAGAGGENAAVLSALQRGADPETARGRARERTQRAVIGGQAALLPSMIGAKQQALGAEAGTATGIHRLQQGDIGQQLQGAAQLGQYNLGAAGLQSQHGLGMGGLQMGANQAAQQQQLALMQAMRSSPMYNPYSYAGMT
jgi:hypothetical protein